MFACDEFMIYAFNETLSFSNSINIQLGVINELIVFCRSLMISSVTTVSSYEACFVPFIDHCQNIPFAYN